MPKKLLISVLLLISLRSFAQDSIPAMISAGVRAGISGLGITLRSNVDEKHAFEGILQTRDKGFLCAVLYEFQKEMYIPGLTVFAGPGFHIGAFNSGFYRTESGVAYRDRFIALGLEAIAGLQFKVPEYPWTISMDFKPYADLIGKDLGFLDAGLSVRYVFQ